MRGDTAEGEEEGAEEKRTKQNSKTGQADPVLFSPNSCLNSLGGCVISNNFYVQMLFEVLNAFDSQGPQCSLRKPRRCAGSSAFSLRRKREGMVIPGHRPFAPVALEHGALRRDYWEG